MKRLKIEVLDERDERIVRLLESAGMNRSMARIIRCLMIGQPRSMKDLGIAANITTSAVSIALKKLRDMGIVRSEKITGDVIGRRTDYYRLNGEIDGVLAIFEEGERRKVARYMEKTARIKEEAQGRTRTQRPKDL